MQQFYMEQHTHTGLQFTSSVFHFSEAWCLVVDVLQFNSDFQQTGVAARVQGAGPRCPLSSGGGPALIAGSFDDDGVDRGLFPVQIPV